MPLTRKNYITREYVRDNRSKIFLFGDNLQRKGLKGQAAQMRGEPNAIGIPTKHAPDTKPGSYFSDWDFEKVAPLIDAEFEKLKVFVLQGGEVVIPSDGLGTGLSKLPTKAPKIYKLICEKIQQLEKLGRLKTKNE